MPFTPPPGAKPNEQGFYVDATGSLLPGQTTPGQIGADKMGLTPQYDAKKGLWFTNPVVNGRQTGANYISPTIMAGPDKKPIPFKDSGGGLLNHPSWDNKKGQWDQGLNWGNIMSLVIAGTLTLGAASVLMGGGEAAEAALSAIPGADVPSAGLGGFLGDGAVIGGIPSELPGAVAAIPAAGPSGLAATTPILEGLATGPGATSIPAAGGVAPGVGEASVTAGSEFAGAGEVGIGGAVNVGADVGAGVAPSVTAGSEFAGPGEAGIGGAGPNVAAPTVAAPTASGVATTTAQRIAKLIGAAGKGVGDAATAAGNNALDQEKLGLTANGQNIAGQSAFEQELIARAKAESDQRGTDLKNIAYSDYAQRQPVSPYNTRGATPHTAQYLAALGNLAGQGASRLATGPQYSTPNMPGLNPYKPINPADVQGATNTHPGTLATVSNWLSPTLSTVSALANLWK